MAAENAVMDRLDTVTKSLGDLAMVVRDMAVDQQSLRRRVFKMDEDSYDAEEEYEMVDKGDEMPEDVPPEGYPEEEPMQLRRGNKVMKDHMNGEEEEDLADLPVEDDMMKASRNKGYANVAQQRVDEEDSPFDEQQDNAEGNEPSPAGKMGGNRDDETFNVSFSALMSEISSLKKAVESSGITVAKSVVPSPRSGTRGRTSGPAEPIMDREMQSEVKSRSYREINQLREQIGELPRHAFSV